MIFTPDSPFVISDSRQKRWAIPYHLEALNSRADILMIQNQELFNNSTVLDLGCYFGTFSWLASQLGASFVTGVDISVALIDKAQQLFFELGVDKEKHQFLADNIRTYIDNCPDQSVDTILCFGLLYYLDDPLATLKSLRRIARKAVIIDTFTAFYALVQGKDSAQFLTHLPANDWDKLALMLYSQTKTDKTDYCISSNRINSKNVPLGIISGPTIALLELFFAHSQWNFERLSWEKYCKNPTISWQNLLKPEEKIASHWTDVYSSNIRVSYILKP